MHVTCCSDGDLRFSSVVVLAVEGRIAVSSAVEEELRGIEKELGQGKEHGSCQEALDLFCYGRFLMGDFGKVHLFKDSK